MRRITPVVAVLLVACTPKSTGSHMWTHYQRVAEIQSAVLTGNLDLARAGGRWVAAHEATAGSPAGSAPYEAAMRAAARDVENAQDVREAAAATARIGAACGDCHAALGRGPRFADPTTPPAHSDTAVAQQMTLHLWALDRMWDGLAGPSDQSWARGAISLADVPRFQQHLRRVGLGAAAADSLAQRLHALSQRATLAERAGRTEVFGQMLGTCATCHQGFSVRIPVQGSM